MQARFGQNPCTASFLHGITKCLRIRAPSPGIIPGQIAFKIGHVAEKSEPIDDALNHLVKVRLSFLLLSERQVAIIADNAPPTTDLYLQRLDGDAGLDGPETRDFLRRLALRDGLLTPATVLEVSSRLQQFGPMWIMTGFLESPLDGHAEVVIGIHGDGTPDGTFLRIIDPADGRVHNVTFSGILVDIYNFQKNRPKFPEWLHF
jgi:Papain-like cysteine protease AvrRpt2